MKNYKVRICNDVEQVKHIGIFHKDTLKAEMSLLTLSEAQSIHTQLSQVIPKMIELQRIKYEYAIVIGKFLPYHNGHKALIEYALTLADRVIVIICHDEYQFISPETREQMIYNSFKYTANCDRVDNIWTVLDDVDESISAEDYSERWAIKIRMKLINNHKYLNTSHIIVGSDEYIPRFARYMSMAYDIFDMSRDLVPTSGTLCRANASMNYHNLPKSTRQLMPLKICFIGPESVGKSTLTKQLAKQLDKMHLEEYGRTYFNQFKSLNDEWNINEFNFINSMQHKQEVLALNSNDVVICDTDTISTQIWCKRYTKQNVNMLESYKTFNPAFLYILINPTAIPFVQDGTRESEHVRFDMFTEFKTILVQYNLNYIVINSADEIEKTLNGIHDHIKAFRGEYDGR